MKVNQENGVQKRPYADHIYSWIVDSEGESEEQVLEYCLKNLKSAKRNREQYFKEYRESKDFERSMEIVCGGYYELKNIGPNKYEFKAIFAYID